MVLNCHGFGVDVHDGGIDRQVMNFFTASGIDVADEVHRVTGGQHQAEVRVVGAEHGAERNAAVVGSDRKRTGADVVELDVVRDRDTVVGVQVGGELDVGGALQHDAPVGGDIAVDVERTRVCIECGAANGVLGRAGDVDARAAGVEGINLDIVATDIGADIDDGNIVGIGIIGGDRHAAGERLDVLADRDDFVGVEIDIAELAGDTADGVDSAYGVGVVGIEREVLLRITGEGFERRCHVVQRDAMAGSQQVGRGDRTENAIGQGPFIAVIVVGFDNDRTGRRRDDCIERQVLACLQRDRAAVVAGDDVVDGHVVIVDGAQRDVVRRRDCTGRRDAAQRVGDNHVGACIGTGIAVCDPGDVEGAGILDSDSAGGVGSHRQGADAGLDGIGGRTDAGRLINREAGTDDVPAGVICIGNRGSNRRQGDVTGTGIQQTDGKAGAG